MKKIILSLFILYPLCSGLSQIPDFKYHTIGTFGDKMGQTSLVDVDNDSDLDWVFGSFGTMYWYEYITAESWKLHNIGAGAKTDVGGNPLDVNKDGWVDFVVGDSWYENTQKPRVEEFVLHKKNMIGSHDNVMVDINGDGTLDVVSVSNDLDHPVLVWYRIPTDIHANWDYTKIGAGIHGGIDPLGYGDLDNDGDMDIIRGNVWFENTDSEGKAWKKYETLTSENGNRPGKYGLALKTWCIDLDNDNDLDVIQAEADTENGRVYWFENQNNAESFLFHPISASTTNQDFHSLSVADFDNDGDMDILSGGGPLSLDIHKVFIWENTSKNGLSWKEHLILSGKRIHEAVAADVDQDGDIDICGKPWNGKEHFYLENTLID